MANGQPGFAQQAQAEALRQFNLTREREQPFLQAGTQALGQAGQQFGQIGETGLQANQQQAALSGALGPEAQQAAIAGIQAGPQFGALQQAGEQSILQNASATGGLRGGNVQGALAQFSPQLLQSLIEQQFGQLGAVSGQGLAGTQGLLGLGQIGAGSAGRQAQAGTAAAGQVGAALGQENLIQAQQQAAAQKQQQELVSGFFGLAGTGLGLL